jgi:O-methyltransferase
MRWIIYTTLKKVLDKFGYTLHKKVQEKNYIQNKISGCYTYSPCFDEWFKKIYDKIRKHTFVTEDRCYIIYRFVEYCNHIKGDMSECGVYKGGTSYLIAHKMNKQKTLFSFDTFEGMPVSEGSHNKGDFNDISFDKVKDYYLSEFNNVNLIKGKIPKSFSSLHKEHVFSFVHVDVDLYSTSKDCCEFFYPKMEKGGIMLFDDYGMMGYKLAEKKAVDEYFEDKPEKPICLSTGQAFIIKT